MQMICLSIMSLYNANDIIQQKSHWLKSTRLHDTGCRKPIGCLQLQVSFRKRDTIYRAFLRKMTCKNKASDGSSPPCREMPFIERSVALRLHNTDCRTYHQYLFNHSEASSVTFSKGRASMCVAVCAVCWSVLQYVAVRCTLMQCWSTQTPAVSRSLKDELPCLHSKVHKLLPWEKYPVERDKDSLMLQCVKVCCSVS